MVATSSRLRCLCLLMQYRGLKENNWLFSLVDAELEATVGLEMAVAQLEREQGSLVLSHSDS